MLTEIGALVAIVKALFDTAKTGVDLFGKRGRSTKDLVAKLQERMAGIAEQLHQSVALSKMLPIWLKEIDGYDLFTNRLTDEEVRKLDGRLRDLISDSIHDHFSGTFFRTSFKELPEVDRCIEDFRSRLVALEKQLDGIPPGDAVSWRRSWPLIKSRIHDLRIEAVKIDNLADKIHSDLIVELRDASRSV